jgi:hypothetical protein
MKNLIALACVLGPAGCAGGPAASEGPALIFFVGAACPVSDAYAPDIHRIAGEWSARGGRVWIVYPEPGLRLRDAEAHAGRFGLPGTLILDASRSLASAHGVTRVPTAVVPGAYKGRIDDRHSAEGKRRRHDLEDALDALAHGRAPAVRETPVVAGCPLP